MQRVIFAAVLLISILASCSDPTGSGKSDSPIVVRTDLPRGMLYLNDSTFARVFTGSGGNIPVAIDGVSFESSNENVLTISNTGLMRSMGYGTATVTATRSGQSASMEVRVVGTLHAAVIDGPQTWSIDGSPHVVDSLLSISGKDEKAVLTIDPGVLVLFRKNRAGIEVGRHGRASIVANGANGTIRFEAEDSIAPAGYWRGIEFMGNDTSILNGVNLRQCGGPGGFPPYQGCLMFRSGVYGSTAVTLVDVSIREALTFGFVIEDGIRVNPGSARLSVEGVEGHAGWYPGSQLPTFPHGGTFRDIAKPVILLTGGVISQNMEWKADPGIAWVVQSDIVVGGPAAPVLRIDAGLDIHLQNGIGILVGESEPGSVEVGSPGGSPVIMNYDGYGDWGGLMFGPHAGPSSLTSVYLNRCSSCLRMIGDDNGSAPEVLVADVEITNAGRGAELINGGRFAEGSRNLTITGSGQWPVSATIETAHTIPTGTYTGNGMDRVMVYPGELSRDVTWRDIGIMYDVNGGLDIVNSSTLTLEPGVRIAITPGGQLVVGQFSAGTLRAVGTATQPIVFTSALEEPSPDSWLGVNIGAMSTAETLLDHVIVEYAGTAIQIATDLGPIVRNTLIRESAHCGIRRGPGTWITDFTVPDLGNRFENTTGPDQCGP